MPREMAKPETGSKLARQSTNDGHDLVNLHVAILRGTQEELDALGTSKPRSVAEKQASAAWLADRGFGKARNSRA